MRKSIIVSFFIILTLFLVYISGPKASRPLLSPVFPSVPSSLADLRDSIRHAESLYGDSIMKGCASEIFWRGDSMVKTPYSVVYLHGYSATKYEGLPVAEDFARRYGMNLYMPRLQDHGFITSEPLLHMTADGLWESAKNALAVGEKLGDKVIIMSTSTGGTLALYLAALYPEKIHALINISPNILPAATGVKLLSGHWGKEIARMAQGGLYLRVDSSSSHPEYWSEGPRIESAVQMQCLVDATMTPSTFAKVKAPSLTLAYYKDEKHQDPTVRVDKIREMHALLGSKEKRYAELPTVGVHPMACGVVSQDIPAVRDAVYEWTENVMGIIPYTQRSMSEGDM